MNNPIAEILNIPATHLNFTFEGRDFQYSPRNEASRTAETLTTNWAEGTRTCSAINNGGEASIRQQLAAMLAHKFRKGQSAAERDATLEAARKALS